jgi:signal transduction histidine kinase
VLALAGGYLVSRALTQRVKRLERAAEQVAAGDFGHAITVDSTDELGQLAQAFKNMQRQLGQLESARKQFIATASHELRTPIFSLGGFVELLEDEDLDDETRRRFLDQVRDQVERLRKLSVDLLDLSKLEAGSLELRPEQVDLGELTRAVSGEFEPALAGHDSHLELRLSTRAIEALCDPVRVAQIMRILIDNALTHTPPGTRIVVTAGRDDGHVRLAVRDDGEGIRDGAIPRIFEPFFTADDAQGSGLGLAIASELAERMAGRLSVRSGPGETVFTLEIPA